MDINNKALKIAGISILVLAILSVLIGALGSPGYLESFRIVFGSVYVLFLPGLVISYIFFPKTKEFEEKKEGKDSGKGEIDWIERIALSFALSIAIVPLVVFYLNLLGVRINLLNSFLTILGIILIGSGVVVWRGKRNI